MKYKVEIWQNFRNYKGGSIVFRKIFELPFIPFYGLSLLCYEGDPEDCEEYDVDLFNDKDTETVIRWDTNLKMFQVVIKTKVGRHTINGWSMHRTMEHYSDWERIRDCSDPGKFQEDLDNEP